MNEKILITYASKAGCTAEVAVRIGEILQQRGAAVDVLPVQQTGDPAGYRAVVVGSVARMGQPAVELTRWVQTHAAALQQIPFSAFMTCLTLQPDTAETRAAVQPYLDSIRALVQPAQQVMFAGVMDPKKLTLVERLMMKAMKSPTGDFRRWDLIEAWAQDLPLG